MISSRSANVFKYGKVYPVELDIQQRYECVQVRKGHPLLNNIVNILLNLLLESRMNLQQDSKAPEQLYVSSYLPQA